jgi:predicted AlkP superfamily pyrophosphatase or phosphodiesterase
VNDPGKIAAVRNLLERVPGVEAVWGEAEKKTHGLDHPRAGELVAIADKDSWFTYYYWLDDRKAPDFARIVDIHKKPGYDPVEMFADPTIKMLPLKVGAKVLKKKLGFRMLMDIIPLDATLIRGSHGRYPDRPEDGPLLITRNTSALPADAISAVQVYDVMLALLRSEKPVLQASRK